MKRLPKLQANNPTSKVWDELKADYENVFGSPAGLRVIEDIKKSGFISKTSFIRDNAHQTSFNEGIRHFALHMLDMATPRPEAKEDKPKAITGE